MQSFKEDNGDFPQKIPCMYSWNQCPQTCSRPPPTHASTEDPWTATGKFRTVFCGFTALFSWVLIHKFLLCPPRVYFRVLCKFWQLHGGVSGNLLKENLCQAHTQSPVPAADHCQPIPPQETLKHSSVSVSVGSLGPGVPKVCLSPLSISGGNGVSF